MLGEQLEVDSDMVPLEQYRRFYAEEIRALTHSKQSELVDAFARVHREKFLGPAPWQVAGETFVKQAQYRTTSEVRDLYHNVLVAIKSEKSLNSGQPSALARWIGALELAKGMRVFHVGCGVGYYTAIMAEIVGSTGSVVGAEVDCDLAARAADNLHDYANVTIHSADGALLDPGPCDAIFINAGVTHPHLPWLQSLSDEGRMVLPLTAPMAPSLGRGVMARIVSKQGRFAAEVISQVAIYSSTTVRNADLEPLLNDALNSGQLLQLKSIRLDAHEPVNTCIVHASDVCLSSETAEEASS